MKTTYYNTTDTFNGTRDDCREWAKKVIQANPNSKMIVVSEQPLVIEVYLPNYKPTPGVAQLGFIKGEMIARVEE